jgi:hypothetical protein
MPKIRKDKLNVTISTSVSQELFDILFPLARDYYIKGNISAPTIAELLRYIIENHLGSFEQMNQLSQALKAPIEIRINQSNDSREQQINNPKHSDSSVEPKEGPKHGSIMK